MISNGSGKLQNLGKRSNQFFNYFSQPTRDFEAFALIEYAKFLLQTVFFLFSIHHRIELEQKEKKLHEKEGEKTFKCFETAWNTSCTGTDVGQGKEKRLMISIFKLT